VPTNLDELCPRFEAPDHRAWDAAAFPLGMIALMAPPRVSEYRIRVSPPAKRPGRRLADARYVLRREHRDQHHFAGFVARWVQVRKGNIGRLSRPAHVDLDAEQ
jgi:hypothetical protein